MPDGELSSIFSHLVLAGSCGWAHQNMHGYSGFVWMSIAYMLHHAVGILGVLIGLFIKFGNSSDLIYRTAEIYNFFFSWSLLVGLPSTVAQLYLSHGYPNEIAILHILLSLVPLITDSRSSLDFLIGLNLTSLAFLGVATNNLYAMAMAICYAVNYFDVRRKAWVGKLRAKDVYICLLALFTYLSIKAL